MASYKSYATGNWNAETTWGITWVASTAKELNDWVTPTVLNGYVYECAVAGTTGATEPTWPTVIGNTVADGTVTWTCRAQYPQTAGDIFTISAGHTVTYNVSQTAEFAGDSNIFGLLTFAPAINTKLVMANGQRIVVKDGGELRVGAAGAVIGASYLAELYWNETADDIDALLINAGGKWTMAGDPALYGSDDDTTLAADWTAGQTFTATGDFTAKWAVGQEITVHRNIAYGGYNTDTRLFTIASLALNGANTDITINEAAPAATFNAGGLVLNVSRNIKFGKLNPVTTIGNYNVSRPGVQDDNTVAGNVSVSNAQITGIYRIYSGKQSSFSDNVVRNSGNGFTVGANHNVSGNVYSNNYVFYYGANHNVSGNVYSNNYVFYQGANYTVSGNVYSNNNGFYQGANYTVSGNVYSNNYVFYQGANHNVSGNVYSNVRVFYQGANHTVSGRIGYTATDVSAPNTTDFVFSAHSKHNLQNAKMPQAGLVFANRNTDGYKGGVFSEDHNRVMGASYQYDMFADIIRNTTTLRTGGADNSIEVVPLSNCSSDNPVKVCEWHETAVPASAQTRLVYMKGEGWTSWPTNTQLYLEALYLDEATGGHRASAASTAVLTDNVTWVAFSVGFTPAQAGIAKYRVWLKTYEASSKIFVDNQLRDAA